MKIRRIMIAAPKSGSGKTIVTCALLQILKEKGENVVSFKCGPDYIDPMFHEKTLGIPSGNLDTFFTGEETTRRIFRKHAEKKTFAVLEGVMGLYDGLGGVREEGSSYHLAKVTGTPIVLVADVKGMGQSIVPLLAGFLKYDREHLIRGVILNRISKGYYETVKPLIERELGLLVLGFLPEQKAFQMESRHLGLVLPNEQENLKEKLTSISRELESTVSLRGVQEIADSAGEITDSAEGKPKTISNPVIAVAKDEAFCFYYKENLMLLEEYGARIQFFSPLHDKSLPKDCRGILLGGGYPELYAKELSQNVDMRRAVKQTFLSKMPMAAECGGFLYLHDFLTDREGIRYAMAGVIPAECFDTGKTVRFGYVEIQEKEGFFLPKGETIKGHEFHYYDSTDNGNGALAVKPVTGRSYSCVMTGENYWFGFPHLYYPSNPAFAKAFVQKAERWSFSSI
ncbi:MAG: cobyrinate a,c-diamide synthase [Lachnospiraceae bacterium]|nr:cobyrinate a,c-diamide synthase [Lachnospiraceae bacterium]